MPEHDSQGISRRDLLKRGAALGGAVVWATPVVQTLGMGRAFASTASPVETRISFIAFNVLCGDNLYFIKWENGAGWEDDPGNNNPNCQLPGAGTPYDGGKLDIEVKFKSDGCAYIENNSGCRLGDGVVFGAKSCEPITDFNNICITGGRGGGRP